MHRLLSVIAVFAAGCASTAVPLEELAQVSPDTLIGTGGLIAGARVGMAPWRACSVEVYPPDASVTGPGGESVGSVFPRGELSRLLVTQLLVDPDRPQALVVDVTDEHGTLRRLAIKAGEQADCLIPWTEDLQRLHDVVGTVVAFHPNSDSCKALALRGDGVRKLIDGTAVERAFEVTAITINEQNGRATPWLRVGGIEVRHDVLASCFAPATTGEATALAPVAIETIAGAYPGTCRPGREGGVECVSSVVVWQGKVRDNLVDLRRVRRTLGAVLVRDGAITAAPMNERVIINIPEVRNQRIATVRQGAVAAMQNLAARPVASIAIADATTTAQADMRIDVELRDLTLGRLTTGRQPATSEYILRYEDKYNPAYDEAQNALNKARSDREVANSQYQAALAQYQTTKQACAAAGQEAKKLVGGVWGSILGAAGEAGCDIALAPSNEELVKAEVAVSTAESTVTTTPRMVKAPVTAPWNYEKTTYRRTLAVNVVLKIQDTRSGASETRTVPVEYVWEDFTASRDEAHNVEGHEIAAAMLASADGLLPDLAARVEASLRGIIGQRVVELGLPAARAALTTGFGVVMGDQLVDSSAYLVARERLRGNLARGEVKVAAGKPTMAGLGSLSVPPKTCLMVVAVPADMSKQVRLSAKAGTIADSRGVVPAYFEVCGEADGVNAIEITSDGDGVVRWAAYSTSLFETTVATTTTSP